MKNDKRHVDLVGPAFLIGIGVILLLSNLGYLNWSLWDIFSLWPIFLVAAGLELLIGKQSRLGSMVAAVVVLVAIIGGVWFASASPGSAIPQASAIEISEPLGDTTALDVKLDPAVARIDIGALNDSGNVVEGSVQHRRNERITSDFKAGSSARLTLGTQGSHNVAPFGLGRTHLWNLNFHPDVALKIDLDMGISEANLDLSALSLDEVNVDFGIGDVQIQLPETGKFSVNIDGGIGIIVIEVPEGMAVRLRPETGIVMRSLPDDYAHFDGDYTSPNYRDAENRVDIRLGLGIGSVILREIPGN